jgi:hypothetical protein
MVLRPCGFTCGGVGLPLGAELQGAIMDKIGEILDYLMESRIEIDSAIGEYPTGESTLYLDGQLLAVDEIIGFIRELRGE